MIEAFAKTLQAAQAGEEWAIASLWRDLQPRLLRFLSAREPFAAEDLASETWLRAARDLRRFDGGEIEFRAWMFTIARHALIDWQRRARRRPELAPALEEVVDAAPGTDPAERAVETFDTESALRLIARLPDDQAEVILLRVVAGLDAGRVARIMGKKEGTIRVLQHRGLRRLAGLLGSDEPADEDVTN